MMHDVPYKKDDFMTEDYKGLSGSEVSQRVEAGKVNTTTNSISRTKKEIFRAHLCTFFNFLNVFLGALVLMTGQIKNLTFMFTIIANSVIGIIQELKVKSLVDKLSVITASKATVIRDGTKKQIPLDEIVVDDDDYIYLRQDLVSLSGRKLHQKKNHLNYFQRTFQATYEEIRPENAEEVLAFLERINGQRLAEMPPEWKTILALETRAIEELLSLLHTGRLLTGVIRIDGKIEAVTIGEYARTCSHESVLVHVEKANPAYRGIYQAINHSFCCRLPEDTIFVNREEDMGMENLRQTKMSYKPVRLAEKYEAAFVK